MTIRARFAKHASHVASLSLLVPAAAFAQPQFIDPGTAPNIFGAKATCVSRDGNVVAGESHYPFRWTESGGFQQMGLLGEKVWVEGINSDGSLVVGTGFSDNNGVIAVKWGWSGWCQSVQWPLPTEPGWTRVCDISDVGNVIVGWTNRGLVPTEAYLLTTQAGIQLLGTLPGSDTSEANAISSDGTIVVGTSGTAFVWSSATGMRDLGALEGWPRSAATALSDDGLVIVGYSDSSGQPPSRATIWIDGTPRPLGVFPDGTLSLCWATSADGRVVVGEYGVRTRYSRAFAWSRESGVVDLTDYAREHNLIGESITLTRANDVSGDGSTIVGVSFVNNQYGHAFILRNVVLPAAACPPCTADFDRDGGVTAGDLGAFTLAYDAAEICADVDGDSAITAQDVASFFAAFERGGCD